MKRIVLVVSISLLLFKFALCEEVVLGYFELPPHIATNEATGETIGVLPDFLNNVIGSKMGVSFKFVKQPLARILQDTKTGKIDGGALFGYNDERAKVAVYPNINFSQMSSIIAVQKNNSLNEVKTIDDIADFKIGYMINAFVSPFAAKVKDNMDLIGGNNTYRRNIKKVVAGRVDALYCPIKENIVIEAKKLNLYEDIKILNLPEPPQKLYTIWSKSARGVELENKYSKAMNEIEGERIYGQMLDESTNQ